MGRGKKALVNTSVMILNQIVTVLCGLILPRLILSHWGSDYNGLVSSITQFLSCIALLKAGVTGVSLASLYKPIALNDNREISAIINATQGFMKKISLIFSLCLLSFAFIYPLFVSDEFNYYFTFTLFIIIGISTVFQYYFGITNQILLAADQKSYIYYIFQTVSIIINTVTAVVLIRIGCGIHFVKIASAMIYTISPILLNLYVTRKYTLDKRVPPNYFVLSQRWDAIAHSISEFIHTNTDVIVLTIFTNIREVSVYSVYNLVIRGIKMVVNVFVTGIEAAFGDMIARKEDKILRINFTGYETMIFIITSIIYTCTAVLLPNFAKIYTLGVLDVNYFRPTFTYIISCAEFFYCIRYPYIMLIHASGHFKQTKKYAISEAVINIVLSIALVNILGLIGVAIGTVVAMIYRTLTYVIYTDKYIIPGVRKDFFKKLLTYMSVNIAVVILFNILQISIAETFFEWIKITALLILIICLLIGTISVLFFKNTFFFMLCKMKNIIKR